MKLQTKIALCITPLVISGIFVLGVWSLKKAEEISHKSAFLYLNTIIDSYLADVNKLHNLLERNGLDKVASFVSNYKQKAFRAGESIQIPASAQIFIINESGRLVFCSKKNSKNVMETFWGPVAQKTVKTSESVSGRYLIVEGVEELYVIRRFKPWRWTIFFAMAHQEVHDPELQIRNATIGIASICAILSILLVLIVFKIFFVVPIHIIGRSASAIANGESVKKIDVLSKDELGDLARNMEAMSGSIQKHRAEIKKSYNDLENRVEERTFELSVANGKLIKEIEERKRAEEASEAANHAKSTFLANMSHELRTPLNAILGFSQLLGHSANLASEQQEDLGIIRRSGEHLLTLINQVLDLSKIEAGRITLDKTDFDLYLLLDEIEDMFRLHTKSKGLELLFERAPDVPRYIRTDKVKFRQVLINILNNAIKFTKQGGMSVRIKQTSAVSKTSIASITFEVEDTGPGIAPDELNNVFEAFVQTETGRESYKGTGLGMAISRRFVELMGGEIQADSEVGRGTTFTFQIRAGLSEAADIETGKPDRKAIALKPNQPRYRILIVDDMEDNRQLLINLLKSFGFELREAANGREAIEIWKAWRPHLIWMDIIMPAMDGHEATKRIREAATRTATPNPVIIAITAASFEQDRAAALSVGCDDFLCKPFREADVWELMTKHLGVRFVYEESAEKTPAKSEHAHKNILTLERWNAMPEELTAALKTSAERTDPKRSNAVINRIREHDEPLADALAELVRTYRFDIIQEL